MTTDGYTPRGKRVLVTGGAGFIGSHLANRLAEANEVVVLDNFATGTATHLDTAVEVVEGDVTDSPLVSDLVADSDVVVHMAAMMGVRRTLENPLAVLEVNMEGTRTILRAMEGANVDRILFASTSEVYGDVIEPPYRETDDTAPKTNYAVSKLADECYLREFCRRAGIEYTVLRYFNVYGPRQDSSEYGYVVPRFVERACEGEPLPVHGDGSQTRDFTYIADAIEATVRALGPAGANEAFNVGRGVEVSIADLGRTVVDTVGNGEVTFVDHPRPYTVTRRCADISKARAQLGYEPQYDIADGVRRLAATFRTGARPARSGP